MARDSNFACVFWSVRSRVGSSTGQQQRGRLDAAYRVDLRPHQDQGPFRHLTRPQTVEPDSARRRVTGGGADPGALSLRAAGRNDLGDRAARQLREQDAFVPRHVPT